MASSHPPKTENPVSPSVAIEFTAHGINGYFKNEIIDITSSEAINFTRIKNVKNFVKRLQELNIPDEIKDRQDTYWTIGIPDNSSQDTRKAINQAVENFRIPSLKSPGQQNLEDIPTSAPQQLADNPKIKQPPIRLINRSTAGAISYLQSLRDQERLNPENEGDVHPYLPSRHFLVMFVDGHHVYGAEFKTIDGLVQHAKSYIFDDKQFESSIEVIEKATDKENLLPNLNNLWTVIVSDGIRPQNRNEYAKIAVLFTYNSTSFLITDSQINIIPSTFVNSSEDKFSLFPSINNKPQQWPDSNKFVLKGINVKTRMLAGDADMIDYDVPSGFIGEAIIKCKDKFKASLIRDGEKLPIYRTIFKAAEKIKFEVNYEHFGFYKGHQDEFICKVDDNGIITNIESDKFVSAAKQEA